MKTSILLSAILFIVTTNLYAQEHAIVKIIEQYASDHKFNGTILIKKEDTVLHHKSYGLANREFNVKNSIDTRYKIASITKLFTAVLIYQLVEQEKVKLDNLIVDYYPNYKGEGKNKVTIHQLLTSTSGIENLEKKGDQVYEKRLTIDQIISKYASGPLEFMPGSKFSYNNADYIILGKILENIYDVSFKQIIKQQILDPLNMKNTGVFDYEVVSKLAQCYWRNEKTGKSERDVPYFIENYYASGAMYSTTSDLLTFTDALFNNQLINKNNLSKLLETESNIEKFDNYASGLWSFSFKDDDMTNNIASRPGTIWGAETMLQRFIEKKTSIILLSNGMETSNTWELLRMLQPYLK